MFKFVVSKTAVGASRRPAPVPAAAPAADADRALFWIQDSPFSMQRVNKVHGTVNLCIHGATKTGSPTLLSDSGGRHRP